MRLRSRPPTQHAIPTPGDRHVHAGDPRGGTALTASLLALPDGSGVKPDASAEALLSIEDALAAGKDAFLAWTGFENSTRISVPPRKSTPQFNMCPRSLRT